MPETKIIKSKNTYFEAVGRRKSAVARVRLTPSSENSFNINSGRKVEEHFKAESLELIARGALTMSGGKKFDVSVILKGGGIKGQAEAMRLGMSRALVLSDHDLRGELKKAGFLKRDPRVTERKKFGLLKARKSPKWSKR